MTSTVTSNGEVTVPRSVRDRLGIVAGGEVSFEISSDGRVFLAKSAAEREEATLAGRFARLRGSAGSGMTTDEVLAITRGADLD